MESILKIFKKACLECNRVEGNYGLYKRIIKLKNNLR